MIKSFNGKTPKVAETAFVSEFAYVMGDVEIGEGSVVWPGAVIRGDFGSIRIGKFTQIEDNAVVHAYGTLTIGDNVIVAHSAVVHCRKIGNNVLVGNNATVLDGTEIGEFSVVGANSMVRTEQKIPPRSFVVGVPAKIKSELLPAQMDGMISRMSGGDLTGEAEKQFREGFQKMLRQYKEQGL